MWQSQPHLWQPDSENAQVVGQRPEKCKRNAGFGTIPPRAMRAPTSRERIIMTTSRFTAFLTGLTAIIVFCSYLLFAPSYAQQPAADVAIDADDIGGVVTGPKGPEAGVWVIAETRDLPVRYIKTVVTDDRGRFVVPDLPTATYQVWARGYGLVDSAKSTAKPGQRVSLTAVVAPNEAAAAHYYPAIYWYSMLKIPAADQFG